MQSRGPGPATPHAASRGLPPATPRPASRGLPPAALPPPPCGLPPPPAVLRPCSTDALSRGRTARRRRRTVGGDAAPADAAPAASRPVGPRPRARSSRAGHLGPAPTPSHAARAEHGREDHPRCPERPPEAASGAREPREAGCDPAGGRPQPVQTTRGSGLCDPSEAMYWRWPSDVGIRQYSCNQAYQRIIIPQSSWQKRVGGREKCPSGWSAARWKIDFVTYPGRVMCADSTGRAPLRLWWSSRSW
jgi:hypothetical protein